MLKSRPVRRISKWASTLLAAASGAALVVSMSYAPGYDWPTSTKDWAVWIEGGAIMVSVGDASGFKYPARVSFDYVGDKTYLHLVFVTMKGSRVTITQVPLWPATLLCALAAGPLWWIDVRRTRRENLGLCPSCGYDRRGLAPDAICPECGQKELAGPLRHSLTS